MTELTDKTVYMTVPAASDPIYDYLKGLKGEDRFARWTSLVKAVGRLFEGDPSLRGDLAHMMLYLGSRKRPNGGMSFSAYTEALCNYCDALFQDRETGCYVVDKLDVQAVRQFVHRENETHKVSDVYLVYILFLLSTAHADGGGMFFNHYIQKEVGQLQEFVQVLMSRIREKARLQDVTSYVEEFTTRRNARNQLKYDLGGMLELGNFGSAALWHRFFGDAPTNDISGNDSRERHYVCYRFSSSEERPWINKSFLVFQSPGRVKGSNNLRHHFAFKLFYRNSLGILRRSAGAVIQIGSTITCYGSSEMLPNVGTHQGIKSRSVPRGPKSIVFNAEEIDSPIMFGVTVTMNEERLPICSRLIAIETTAEHSDQAKIGTQEPGSMVDELKEYTVFGSRPQLSETFLRERWADLVETMKADSMNGTITSELVRDFKFRGLF